MKLFLAALLTLGAGLAQAATLAYTDPTGPGDQAFPGALGMDFNVNAPIMITGLGAFDSSQDGFTGPIDVQIYNRATGTVFGGLNLVITGTQGTIMGGDRVVTLGTPVILPPGFQGSIVASGFSASDLNGNSNPSGITPGSYSTTNTGGGLISFVGNSRYGFVPAAYPTNIDGDPAKYGAGTFTFAASAVTTPEPGSMALLGIGLVGAALLRRKQAKS